MAANGKPRHYEQVGAAMLTSEVKTIVLRLAAKNDRAVAYVIRKLIEESPLIKAALKNGKRK